MRFGKNCQYNCRVDVELHLFIEGCNPGLILPMELKNQGLMGIGKCKLKGPTGLSQSPAAGKIHTRLPAGSHSKFSKNTNRRWRGILEPWSGTRSQELELETLAASRAALPKAGSR